MPPKSKTPDGVAGHAGVPFDGWQAASHHPSNLTAYRAQFLMVAHAVRPEMAAMLAALAFGGGHG